MLVKYNIMVHQNLCKTNTGYLQNEYHFMLQNGVYLGGLLLPTDGQCANVKTTYNIYVHLLEDTKAKEIDKLDSIDKLLM